MSNQLDNMFTFHRLNGKWRSEVNPQWIFQMQTQKGIPAEILSDMLSKMSFAERITAKIKAWARFIKENPQYEKEMFINREMANKNKSLILGWIRNKIR